MNWWPSLSNPPSVTNFFFPSSNSAHSTPTPASTSTSNLTSSTSSSPNSSSSNFVASPSPSSSLSSSTHSSTFSTSSSTPSKTPQRRAAPSWFSHPLQTLRQWMDPILYPATSQSYFEELLKTASTFDQWSAAATILDQMEGLDAWKQEPKSDLYDYKLVQDRYQALREAREAKDIHRLIFLLRTSLSRNLGGMGNPKLYGVCKVGTKSLIEDYISEVVKCLDIVCSESISTFSHRERMEFFLNTRQSFGRSALLLSGGATLALHHIGVIKCLWECKLLPRIISGASGGSIIASFICTHTEQEFPMMFNPAYVKMTFFTRDAGFKGVINVLHNLISTGALFNIDTLIQTVRNMFGDMTFLEAYNRSRRILNITVSSSTVYEMPRLLNYLTAPNVYIWSAVAASCSVPLIFQAAPLMAKDKSGKAVPWNPSGHRWIDGSVESDLPMQKLSELFGVNHFIVCQVNPHVVPFLHKKLVKSKLRNACESILAFSRNEFDLRCNQLRELGLLPELLYRVQSIVSQKYVGDITIIPEIQVSDYINILNNPTSETYLEACFKGERATWPKITIMQNHLRIEMTIDEMLFKCRMHEWTTNFALQSAKRLALQHSNEQERRSAYKPRTKSTSHLRTLAVHSNGNHLSLSSSLSSSSSSSSSSSPSSSQFHSQPVLASSKPLPNSTQKLVSASLGDLTLISQNQEEKSTSFSSSICQDYKSAKKMDFPSWPNRQNGFSHRRRSMSERHLSPTSKSDELLFHVEGIPTDSSPSTLSSNSMSSSTTPTPPNSATTSTSSPPPSISSSPSSNSNKMSTLSHPTSPFNVIFE